MDKIEEIITNQYSPIGLNELGTASLMNRKDSKFVLNLSQLELFLSDLAQFYNILEIENKRIFNYESHYYDTTDLALYKMHLNGKLNRYKIRQRNYLDNKMSFFEVKYKTNHGRTIKSRFQKNNLFSTNLENDDLSFLEQNTNLNIIKNEFTYCLTADYKRITLVNIDKTERVTIDLGLGFKNHNLSKSFVDMAIIEVKQFSLSRGVAKEQLKKLKIKPGGISKYCIGVILLNNKIKYNRLKPKFNRIYKPFKLVS